MGLDLTHPRYYFNRELSWVKFNERVLEEAIDDTQPLLERLKFISIFSSNLDEFFMIRVAGLKQQIHAGIQHIPIDGLSPGAQLKYIAEHVHTLVEKQANVLTQNVLPSLRKKGVRIRHISTLHKKQKEYLYSYFRDKIFPVLTPLAIDPTHPFPQLNGLGLNMLVELREPKREKKIAVIHLPSSLPRFILVPSDNGTTDFVMLESLVKKHIRDLFPNMKIIKVSEFRITRNADLDLSEAEADDLLKLIERELRKRRVGAVVRLEVSQNVPKEHREYLKQELGVEDEDIYVIPTYLDLTAFMNLLSLDYPDLKDKPFTPTLNSRIIQSNSVFEAISQGDIILHHPYESFNHVVEFIEEAAHDPNVLAIKQTLYRTSGKSPIVRALKTAVENGKQVTALIELKARFDEHNNIEWAKELDRSGVSVVYGVLGLKTHCKISMVVRQEGGEIKRYIHLGTGNYNTTTAKVYTDVSYMTCDEEIGEDASNLFNLLTGYSLQDDWKKLFVAPRTLRKNIIKHIQECIKNHSQEEPSHMMMVMNSLVDPEMIQLLYKASMKGIQIDLIVRGICCLKPLYANISENIRVRSIVGRFLEHSRIYYFKSKGNSQIWLSSADLMPRNLNRRVELAFPVLEPALKQRVTKILQTMLNDNVKARELDARGNYSYTQPSTELPLNAQMHFLNEAQKRQQGLDTINY